MFIQKLHRPNKNTSRSPQKIINIQHNKRISRILNYENERYPPQKKRIHLTKRHLMCSNTKNDGYPLQKTRDFKPTKGHSKYPLAPTIKSDPTTKQSTRYKLKILKSDPTIKEEVCLLPSLQMKITKKNTKNKNKTGKI